MQVQFWAKNNGIKYGAIGNTLGMEFGTSGEHHLGMIHKKLEENVGNVIGNIFENMVGTIQKIKHSGNMRDPMKM